jgi:hypothetical protein
VSPSNHSLENRISCSDAARTPAKRYVRPPFHRNASRGVARSHLRRKAIAMKLSLLAPYRPAPKHCSRPHFRVR